MQLQQQTAPSYYKLPPDVHAALLDYLLRRPMIEVEPAVAILRSLEAFRDDANAGREEPVDPSVPG